MTTERIIVKVTFSSDDPFDAQIIPLLKEAKNKAKFLKMASFCYVNGQVQPKETKTVAVPAVSHEAVEQIVEIKKEKVSDEANRKFNEKLSKF